jgi:hypothetical protein
MRMPTSFRPRSGADAHVRRSPHETVESGVINHDPSAVPAPVAQVAAVSSDGVHIEAPGRAGEHFIALYPVFLFAFTVEPGGSGANRSPGRAGRSSKNN